jgi:hypothetical protein
MTRRKRRWRLAVVGLVLLVAALEITVRVAGLVQLESGVATPHQNAFHAAGMFVSDDDDALSYRNRPNAVTEIDGVEYRHDERGWRMLPGPETDAAAAVTAAAVPVAFLGDSTIYGLGLPAADTLPAQVAQVMGGAILPLDLGVCGYGTGQEAALYAAEREQLEGVPLVVLVLFPNDFGASTFRYDERLKLMYLDPTPLPRVLKDVLWHSALYRWVVSGWAMRQRAAGEWDPLDPAHWPPTLEMVKRLSELVAADGRRLLVAHLPAMERLDPYLFDKPVSELARFCARQKIDYVDLLPAFLDERERQCAVYLVKFQKPATVDQRTNFLSLYWLSNPPPPAVGDHHLNADGNRIAAPFLAKAIAAALDLPAPPPAVPAPQSSPPPAPADPPPAR